MPSTLIDNHHHRRKLLTIQNQIIFRLNKLKEQTSIIKFRLGGKQYEATDLELKILFRKAVKSVKTRPQTHLDINDFEAWFIENYCKGEENGYVINDD